MRGLWLFYKKYCRFDGLLCEAVKAQMSRYNLDELTSAPLFFLSSFLKQSQHLLRLDACQIKKNCKWYSCKVLFNKVFFLFSCILGELFTKKPIFPAVQEIGQLELIR